MFPVKSSLFPEVGAAILILVNSLLGHPSRESDTNANGKAYHFRALGALSHKDPS